MSLRKNPYYQLSASIVQHFEAADKLETSISSIIFNLLKNVSNCLFSDSLEMSSVIMIVYD